MASGIRASLKYGCLGLLGLAALVVAALFAVAWIQVRGEEIISSGLEQELALDSGGDAAGTLDFQTTPTPAARVLLDIKDADVVISPGPVGSALRVEASYDSRYFALEQKPAPVGEDPPTWHVWFRRVSGSGAAMHLLHQLVGATQPKIHVWLPRDMPLALHLNTSSGLTQAELGGLQISELYAELSTGGLALDVSEPSAPMERFKIDSRQSVVTVRNLGNASPRDVVIDCTMGRTELDLRGLWRRDADLLLETELAGGSLRLPDGVKIEGLEGLWTSGTEEVPRPTLRFAVESTVGGLEISR